MSAYGRNPKPSALADGVFVTPHAKPYKSDQPILCETQENIPG